jgi:hypothetical protein
MDKQAYLDKIGKAAFKDEFEKLSAGKNMAGAARKALKANGMTVRSPLNKKIHGGNHGGQHV